MNQRQYVTDIELVEAEARLWWLRFWSRVADEIHVPELGPCWVWHGAATKGYGYMNSKTVGGRVTVHVWYWRIVNGPVPEGLQLDHLCRVRRCLRPAHLEPVTGAENVRRAKAAGRARTPPRALT